MMMILTLINDPVKKISLFFISNECASIFEDPHSPNLLGFASGFSGNSPAKVLAGHDEE